MIKINKLVIISAIAGITIIEVVALLMGINGTLLLITTAAIAGLAGWVVPTPKIIKE